ncbi:EXS family-domain-containing protein [Syncephalis pseudoplumigaleata]|uniref:EXS family-domain-containing protein n=1 Tax=Syncephalis pseudoplumigaleata TaxID=1712513 RepID=A0A4P9YVY3_9FUNG|nr:EXS family-domain-containing protein [Syncephalis pseudoplumigaleata]|eukprot:RKP23401.1 EXS family-domain-containing protein [Syncephalis pseudoplumigaleata]
MRVVDTAPASALVDLGDWEEPFPVAFRVLFLICFGIWAWGSNLSLLAWAGIDATRLLAVGGDKGLRYTSIYQLAATFSAVAILGWCAYLATRSDTVIGLVYAGFLLLVVNPLDGSCRRERYRFLRCVGRIFFGALGTTVHLADVILADILTSFAKVFADLYATLCRIIVLDRMDGTASNLMTSTVYGYHWIAMLISLPYALRFKQCLVEYVHASMAADQRRHLANALKYASAFPVIFLSAIQQRRHRNPTAPHDDPLADLLSDDLLSTVWYWRCRFAFVLLNSLYSFYWDVAIDWHLGQAGPLRHLAVAVLLRPILYFGEPLIYYTAIMMDFLLRFTWSLKLSTHLRLDELTAGGFILEWLEVVRRWLWVYFRFEREWVARGYAHTPTH